MADNYIKRLQRIFLWIFLLLFSLNTFTQEDSLSYQQTSEKLEDMIQLLQEDSSENQVNYDGLEIEGLVIDQTITKIGRDFYTVFYKSWDPPKQIAKYTLTIKERPIPGMGTQISLLVDNDIIFRQHLQPRYNLIEALAKRIADQLVNYLTTYEEMKAELGGEDISGTGIY